jgi:hypothetical protein
VLMGMASGYWEETKHSDGGGGTSKGDEHMFWYMTISLFPSLFQFANDPCLFVSHMQVSLVHNRIS